MTAKEHDQALAKIADIKQKQKPNATQTVATLRNAGRITDDDLRKVDALTMKAKTPPPAPSSTPVPSPSSQLAKLHEALEAASAALNGANTGALQAALAGAALGVLIEEAQRVRNEIAGEQQQGACRA